MNRADFCDGIKRRRVIQAGLGGLFGLSLPELLRRQTEAGAAGEDRSRKAVVFLELDGGPSHFETYDPKPHATAEYRGPFNAINTKLPGVQFSERMQKQAAVADKLAVIRSVTHDSASHRTSAHLMQTGFYLRDRGAGDNEMPSTGSIVAKLRGANASGMGPVEVFRKSAIRPGCRAWVALFRGWMRKLRLISGVGCDGDDVSMGSAGVGQGAADALSTDAG